MREIRYFCPRCQGMELDIEMEGIIRVEGGVATNHARCKLCGWEGMHHELIGALSEANELFWTGERIANALIMAATKHAAGPMLQVLELIGLIPRVQGSAEEQKSAEAIREQVIRAVLEGIVTGAFETAAAMSPAHFEKYNPPMAKVAASIFDVGRHVHEHA